MAVVMAVVMVVVQVDCVQEAQELDVRARNEGVSP